MESTRQTHCNRGRNGAGRWRREAITLIELLVVMSVISMLAAMLLPAINSAREAARAKGCQNNLRQFGMGIATHAGAHRTLCSGAFDWRRDGCVTEVGWVADLQQLGTPPGVMLCPSNPAQISETYNDLLNFDPTTDTCVDRLGSPTRTAPDGTTTTNPCRAIAALTPGSEARREIVEKQIFGENLNTNYTASWFLVRTGVVLDESGNLRSQPAGCPAALDSLSSTIGPLCQGTADTASVARGFIPLLGCGATTGLLSRTIGPLQIGQAAVGSMTGGPVLKTTLEAPNFAAGTPRDGADGWWTVWNNQTLQDYRRFGPVHRGTCNVLFADGSVRGQSDTSSDGLLNNGFPQASNAGFTSDAVELSPEDIFSGWQLRPK